MRGHLYCQWMMLERGVWVGTVCGIPGILPPSTRKISWLCYQRRHLSEATTGWSLPMLANPSVTQCFSLAYAYLASNLVHLTFDSSFTCNLKCSRFFLKKIHIVSILGLCAKHINFQIEKHNTDPSPLRREENLEWFCCVTKAGGHSGWQVV